MEATAAIFYQKAPAKRTKDNLIPVRLRIQYKGRKKFYSIKDRISKNEWLFISEEDIKKLPKEVDREYRRIVREAENIIDKIPVFSFGQFEEKYMHKTGSWDNVFSAMIGHIKELKLEQRFSYASTFETTLRHIKEFHTGKKMKYTSRDRVEDRYKVYEAGEPLAFNDITVNWLKRFHSYLDKRGNSTSSIGINMRNIRTLFNLATEEHNVNAPYPFKKYSPPDADDRKIALSAQKVAMIINYETEDPLAQFYRDIFAFSFFACGMNIADILRLRRSDVKGEEIKFLREKTKRSKHPKKISVLIGSSMRQIIKKHGTKAVGHDAYLFPVLRDEWSDQKKFYEVKEFTLRMNDNLKRIAAAVGITERVSSYVSRHSWSTISRDSGASSEYIREQLGHSSVAVTEKYLASFEADTRKKHSELIEQQINSAI
ncbi:MAG: site-specific integrase [Bacteroidales bacterium]|nr:site-specific integrase [Bacteroidales bacterium]